MPRSIRGYSWFCVWKYLHGVEGPQRWKKQAWSRVTVQILVKHIPTIWEAPSSIPRIATPQKHWAQTWQPPSTDERFCRPQEPAPSGTNTAPTRTAPEPSICGCSPLKKIPIKHNLSFHLHNIDKTLKLITISNNGMNKRDRRDNITSRAFVGYVLTWVDLRNAILCT